MDFILLFLILSSCLTQAHVLPRFETSKTLQRDLATNSTVFTLRSLGFDILTPRDDDDDIICDKCSGTSCKRDFYVSRDDCECKKCPPGQKPNLKLDGCQPIPDDNDKKGQCEPKNVLDPSEGGQDKNTAKPKCIPDDSTKCGSGEVPASREKGDSAPKSEVACAKDIDEKDKPACKATEYRYVQVVEGEGGKKAVYSCRKTQKFARDKESRFEETRSRKKVEFDEEQRRKEEEQKRVDEENRREDEKRKKKIRMGKCIVIVPLTMAPDDTDYEFSRDYFDTDFVSSDELMQYWPPDLPTVPDASIDTEEYMNMFVDTIESIELSDAWLVNYIGMKRRSVELDANNTDISPSESHQHQKRFIQAIIGAVVNFLARLATIAARVGPVASRLRTLIQSGRVKVIEAGKSARTLEEMKSAARTIAKNKNWRNCLEGLAPVP